MIHVTEIDVEKLSNVLVTRHVIEEIIGKNDHYKGLSNGFICVYTRRLKINMNYEFQTASETQSYSFRCLCESNKNVITIQPNIGLGYFIPITILLKVHLSLLKLEFEFRSLNPQVAIVFQFQFYSRCTIDKYYWMRVPFKSRERQLQTILHKR